jgi:5,10-methenyltetrahydromethanopterin hydrogenase
MVSRRQAAGVFAGALAVAAFGCGGGGSPDETVQEWADAIAAGDSEAACALMTEEAVADSGGCEEVVTEDPEGAGSLGTLTVVEETETDAVVEATVEGEEDEVPSTFTLVKEDDEWKIDSEPDFD